MIKITRRIGLAALVLIGSLQSASQAQGLFDPVISVNRAAITAYELEQRELFLEILQRSSGMAQRARDSLIEDRLKMAAADRAGIKLSGAQLLSAMEDFAANANLDLDQLLETLAQSGVDEQTYRDFIMVGVTWRELIRARFAARSAPSETEIDRALASAGAQGGVKVLLTEIVLPAGSKSGSASWKLRNKTKEARDRRIRCHHPCCRRTDSSRLEQLHYGNHSSRNFITCNGTRSSRY